MTWALSILAFVLPLQWWPVLEEPSRDAQWIILSVAVPAILLAWPQKPLRWWPAMWGSAFVAYAACSLLWTPSLYDGLNGLWRLALLAIAFRLGGSLPNAAPVLAAFALGISVNAAIAVGQTTGHELAWIIQAAPPAGLFVNRGFLAEAALLALVGVLALAFDAMHRQLGARALLFLALAVGPALAFALSAGRGAYAALMLVGSFALWRWSRVAALAVVIVLIAAAWHNFATVGHSWTSRLIMWQAVAENLTLAGHGIGSFAALWSDWFRGWAPQLSTFNTMTDSPHNDALLFASEFGFGAVLLAACAVASLRRQWHEPVGAIVVAGLFLGLTWFPLGNPVPGFVLALCAGHAARHRRALRGQLRDGGELAYPRADFGPAPVVILRADPGRGDFPAQPRGAPDRGAVVGLGGLGAARNGAGRVTSGTGQRSLFAAAGLLDRLSARPRRALGRSLGLVLRCRSPRAGLAANRLSASTATGEQPQ